MITTAQGTSFQVQMLQDAINYHQNGDADDPACCTAEAPCNTRQWAVGRMVELGGSDLVPVIADPQVEARTQTAGPQASTGRPAANPASDKQISFIKRLIGERDATALTTYPARTLAQIQAGQEVSKTRAKSLIDNLLRAPRIQTAAPAGPAASDAQIGFLRTLAAEHGEEVRASYTKAEASEEITRLIGLREARRTGQIQTPARTAEPGMYRKDGKIYRVQIAVHGSGRPYAKVLTDQGDGEWSFERAPGMVNKLTPADRMTLDEAKEWGTLYGACCVCAATLTDEKSIAEGIGPICGGRV